LDPVPRWPQERGDDKGRDGHREARASTNDAQLCCEEDDQDGIAQSEHGRKQAMGYSVAADDRHDGGPPQLGRFDHSILADRSEIVTRSHPARNPSHCHAAVGSLPTRQVVVVDWPHPQVQLVTVFKLLERYGGGPAELVATG
jgi:hypothetical protein